MKIECFLIEPTGQMVLSLRRYADAPGGEHGTNGYHNAKQFWGITTWNPRAPEPPSRELDLWPHRCPCGYLFKPSDNWQVFTDRLYRRADHPDGVPFTLAEAAPGAIWDADWLHDFRAGPDGLSLHVRLPDGGDWFMDGPSAGNGPGWSRTGKPPVLTVTPSCQHITGGLWHGWLREGYLVDA